MRFGAALLIAWASAGLSGGCTVLFDPGAGGGGDASSDGDVEIDASGSDGAVGTDAGNGSYKCDSQTLALYHFEGNGPQLRRDSCINPSDDSFTTGGAASEGRFDQGVKFDEVLFRGATTLPLADNTLTVDMWVNPDESDQASMGLIAWADTTGSTVFRMVLTRNGDDNVRLLEVERMSNGCASVDNAVSPSVIIAGEWSHVGVIVSAGEITVVVNGLPASSAFPGGMCDPGPLGYLVVGAGSDSTTPADPMFGSIDELRISDTAREDFR